MARKRILKAAAAMTLIAPVASLAAEPGFYLAASLGLRFLERVVPVLISDRAWA